MRLSHPSYDVSPGGSPYPCPRCGSGAGAIGDDHMVDAVIANLPAVDL